MQFGTSISVFHVRSVTAELMGMPRPAYSVYLRYVGIVSLMARCHEYGWRPLKSTGRRSLFLGLSDMRQGPGVFLKFDRATGMFLNSTGRQGCFFGPEFRNGSGITNPDGVKLCLD